MSFQKKFFPRMKFGLFIGIAKRLTNLTNFLKSINKWVSQWFQATISEIFFYFPLLLIHIGKKVTHPPGLRLCPPPMSKAIYKLKMYQQSTTSLDDWNGQNTRYIKTICLYQDFLESFRNQNCNSPPRISCKSLRDILTFLSFQAFAILTFHCFVHSFTLFRIN